MRSIAINQLHAKHCQVVRRSEVPEENVGPVLATFTCVTCILCYVDHLLQLLLLIWISRAVQAFFNFSDSLFSICFNSSIVGCSICLLICKELGHERKLFFCHSWEYRRAAWSLKTSEVEVLCFMTAWALLTFSFFCNLIFAC